MIRRFLLIFIIPLLGFNTYYRSNLYYGDTFSAAKTLTAQNTDPTFSEITTGDAYSCSISNDNPAVLTFAGGATLTSGELDDDSYYIIVACQADYFYTGNNIGDRFKGSAATEQTINVSNTVKKLHDFSANDVICISGVPEDEGVGASVTTGDDSDMDTIGNWSNVGLSSLSSVGGKLVAVCDGTYDISQLPNTLTVGKYYYVLLELYESTDAGKTIKVGNFYAATTENYFTVVPTSVRTTYTGIFKAISVNFSIGDYIGNPLSGITFEVDDVIVQEIDDVRLNPIYRIDSIDSEGVVTLLNADFSDMAAATTGYAASAVPKNYTVSNGGWMAGCDVDPTPVNTNSEFDQWTYTNKTSGSTVAGHMYRIDAQDVIDFTTVGAANNNVNTEFLCTGVVALSANDAVSEITPDGFTVSGLSATNYLVYDTTANTIRFVSDGNTLSLTTDDTISDATEYFYDIDYSDNTTAGLELTSSSTVDFMGNDDTLTHYQGFLTTDTNSLKLEGDGTPCDITVDHFRLYEVDTYAVCDGSNTQASYLMSNEFTITQNRGYNVAYDITSIDAGGLTPVVGLKEGIEIIAAPIDSSQNIKGLGTGDDAGLKASTGTECVVDELTIYEYQ